MPVDPFQSTAYQVGRIVRALTSDQLGNLIFRDDLNPDGVTLSELINSLIAANISVDTDNTFYLGVNSVQDALNYLNQFAYIKYNARFIYVDPTIPDDYIVAGEIYNTISDAVQYADSLIYNGYNNVNILLMGSHRQGASDSTTDVGVFEFNGNTPIEINQNGIKFLGIGKPVIRIKNGTGTSSNRKEVFSIKEDATDTSISVVFQDIDFEFYNSIYSTIFRVQNAPIDDKNKANKGLKITNCSVSFINSTNQNNRFIDVRNDVVSNRKVSNIEVEDIKIGSLYNCTASANEIELFYINHHANTTTILKNINMSSAEQPNPRSNTDNSKVTSFTVTKVLSGNVIISDPILDEKFYWNGSFQSNVITRFLKANSANTRVSIFNPGIVRDEYNAINENAKGITLINDWIEVTNNAKVNIHGGFDERYDIDVQTTATTGGLYVAKPVKSFWNENEIAFGIGHRNELRLGKVTQADANILGTYDTSTYGIPFWFNDNNNRLQYFDGTTIQTLVPASNLAYTTSVDTSGWSSISYSIGSGPSINGYAINITHNLTLLTKHSMITSIFDTDNNILIMPQQIRPINNNSVQIIVASPFNAQITILGT